MPNKFVSQHAIVTYVVHCVLSVLKLFVASDCRGSWKLKDAAGFAGSGGCADTDEQAFATRGVRSRGMLKRKNGPPHHATGRSHQTPPKGGDFFA